MVLDASGSRFMDLQCSGYGSCGRALVTCPQTRSNKHSCNCNVNCDTFDGATRGGACHLMDVNQGKSYPSVNWNCANSDNVVCSDAELRCFEDGAVVGDCSFEFNKGKKKWRCNGVTECEPQSEKRCFYNRDMYKHLHIDYVQ